ncbi:MAG: hypothetical protein M1434_10685 [Chloroflexi bacterium]|nr:hypothetical protein [Chloroflexota bacterium]
MQYTFQPMATDRVQLLPSMFKQRYALNRRYMMSLSSENLLHEIRDERYTVYFPVIS